MFIEVRFENLCICIGRPVGDEAVYAIKHTRNVNIHCNRPVLT